jgi:hypothetical protein
LKGGRGKREKKEEGYGGKKMGWGGKEEEEISE